MLHVCMLYAHAAAVYNTRYTISCYDIIILLCIYFTMLYTKHVQYIYQFVLDDSSLYQTKVLHRMKIYIHACYKIIMLNVIHLDLSYFSVLFSERRNGLDERFDVDLQINIYCLHSDINFNIYRSKNMFSARNQQASPTSITFSPRT